MWKGGIKVKDKIIGIVAVVALVIAIGLVGKMDCKMYEQEQAWQESVQALELEQENVQSRIAELQKQYEDIEELYVCQGILLDDIRTRLHFELFEELEGY